MKMKENWKTSFWITFLLGLRAQPTSGEIHATTRLYNHLLNNDQNPYNSDLAPKCNLSEPIEVKMDIALRQLISLEEKAQVLTSNVWVRVYWTDCRISWNISDYGLPHLTVPYGTLWVPDLALYDSAAEEEMMPGRSDYLTRVDHKGQVSYAFPTVLKSICLVKVTYFPFDKQLCTLKFGSWTYSLDDVDFVTVNEEGDLSNFVKNNEWDVISFEAKRHVANFSIGSYPDIRFHIKMNRRPEFYLMTMLFPCVLVSAIAMIGFLLPAESGEKISLEVTVLLSLAVFLLVISDFLPPSADQFPIIGTYFAAAMCMVSISLVLCVLVLNVHHRGENATKVPSWARRLFLEKLRRKPKYKADLEHYSNSWESSSSRSGGSYKKYEVTDGVNHNGNNHNTQSATVIERLISEQVDALHRVTNHLGDINRADEICEEWRALARVLDRIFLVIYVILSIVISLVLLIPLSESQDVNINER